MRKFSVRIGALATTVLTVLTVLTVSAGPALAEPALPDRTLPGAGDKLFVLQCGGIAFDLLEVNPASGALYPVGAESESARGRCWGQGYYNPADGLIYAVDSYAYDVHGNRSLSTIDPSTGRVTNVVPLTLAGSGGTLWEIAIALSPAGVIYAVDSNVLYTVDPLTGIGTRIGETRLGGQLKRDFYSLAFNPADGLLYGVDWSDGMNWYTLNTTNASLTVVNDTWSTVSRNTNSGLQFDSNGVAWYKVDNIGSIASAVLPDVLGTTANLHGLTLNGGSPYTASFVYIPGIPVEAAPIFESAPEVLVEATPALAETGVDASTLASGAGTIALLLLAGAALVLTRRRQRA